jgi:hypothetical protein
MKPQGGITMLWRSLLKLYAATAILLFAKPAWGQGVYGVSSGLVLEAWPNYTPASCPPATCCGGTGLAISEGTYYISGTPYALSRSQAQLQITYTGGSVDGGAGCGLPPVPGGLSADTVYYCYETQIPTLVCSTTSPWPNGQPSANITIDGGISAKNFIFVGSFMTDNSAQIIPEKRVGEQVILKVAADGGVSVDAGAPDGGIVFNGGIAVCGWPKAAGVNCLNISGTATDTFAPFYPASASAGIFDVHVINNNIQVGNPTPSDGYALVKFYDAVAYFNFPGAQSSVQAEFGIAGGAVSGVPEVETVRLTLNANKLPPPYSSQFNTAVTKNWGDIAEPSVPTGVSAIAVLRGYIEPIQRLFSR